MANLPKKRKLSWPDRYALAFGRRAKLDAEPRNETAVVADSGELMDHINSCGVGGGGPHKLAGFVHAGNDFPAWAATRRAMWAGAGFDTFSKLLCECRINRHADVRRGFMD